LDFTSKFDRYSIDALSNDNPRSFGRLINHCSAHANVVLKIRHQKYEEPIILFLAKHNIPENTQLLWDYGRKYEKFDGFFPCPCGLNQYFVEEPNENNKNE
jgi:SET domain